MSFKIFNFTMTKVRENGLQIRTQHGHVTLERITVCITECNSYCEKDFAITNHKREKLRNFYASCFDWFSQ
jgi:hypothetical protein